MIIGIDFGTCYSSVAVMEGTIPKAGAVGGARGVPTLFMYSSLQNRELYGEDCNLMEAWDHPGEVVRNMKRRIREDPGSLGTDVESNGRRFLLRDVVKGYLGYLISYVKAAGTEFSGPKEIEYATITVPVGIKSGSMMATDYIESIRDILAEAAGLSEDRVSVISEPEAAALSYLWGVGIDGIKEDKTFLVFDLGGGTLDVTVEKYYASEKKFDTLVRKGDLNLGGNDWDAKLREYIEGQVGPIEFKTKDEEADFAGAVTGLKEKLTETSTDGFVKSYGGETYSLAVSRAQFEEATKDLLERAINVFREALESYGESVDTLDSIVLVGGGSNMPQIRRGIEEAVPGYDKSRISIHDPSKAIAKGAAIRARQSMSAGERKPWPVVDIVPKASQTYGIMSERDGRKMLYNMIFINTSMEKEGDRYVPIVIRDEEPFHTKSFSDEKAVYVVYESSVEASECDGRWSEIGDGARPNGLFVTIPIPPEYYTEDRSNTYEMYPELTLDANGIITISIYDASGNLIKTEKGSTSGGA